MAVINISVNGKKISKEVPDNVLLSDFLRDTILLTGNTYRLRYFAMWSMCSPFRWKFS